MFRVEQWEIDMDTHTFNDALTFWAILGPMFFICIGLLGWWVRGVNSKLDEIKTKVTELVVHNKHTTNRINKLEEICITK